MPDYKSMISMNGMDKSDNGTQDETAGGGNFMDLGKISLLRYAS